MQNNNKNAEFIEKIERGDREVFGEVYDTYAMHLFRYISFRVSHAQDVEDLVSNVFLKVFEALVAGKRIHHVRAFLYQTARNAMVDYFRGKARQMEYESLGEDAGESAMHEDVSPVDQVMETSRIKKTLKKIKFEYREIIELRYIEDLEIAEIAITLNKSHVGVRVLLHRAMNALRKKLESNS